MRRVIPIVLALATALCVSFAADVATIAELQEAVARQGRSIQSFVLEGVVCAVIPEKSSVVVQDASATALLEISGSERFRAGDRLQLRGDRCTVTRARFGIQLGTAPVVDNDGAHAGLMKSGVTFLRPGRHPIRLLWFNRERPAVLKLEYEGAGLPRRSIPGSALWRKTKETDDGFLPGLNYSVYSAKGWYALPDFSDLQPISEGTAPSFDSLISSADGVAFRTEGFLEITREGAYTFHVESADGSRLFVGTPGDSCDVVVVGRQETPKRVSFDQALADVESGWWSELEGVVTFAGQTGDGLHIEIAVRNDSIPVIILSGKLPAQELIGRRVRAAGICESSQNLAQNITGRLLVPGMDCVEFLEPVINRTAAAATVLTSAGDVQRLKRTQAQQQLPVRLKGVVTQGSPTSLVLQDFTGGVFVHFSAADWTQQPRIGDFWQIDGSTDAGDFSPVVRATNGVYLGVGTMPEAVRPTWDQLMNGSLDAQYVELHGVVLSVSETGMEVLTRDGKIKVVVDELRLSYAGGLDLFVGGHVGDVPVDEVQRSYVGSIVRMRGCLVAVWNLETGQVKAGEIRLVAAVVSLVEPRPADPFLLETRRVADLFLFDPRANVLKRTKIAGQVIHARSREYYIQDGDMGIRVETAAPAKVQTGDIIEAVGFPQVGGPFAVLMESEIRRTGHASLVGPALLAWTNLLDRQLDSTLVRIDAMLVSDAFDRGQRTLELQAGPHRFRARLTPAQNGRAFAAGSLVQLTGVYTSIAGNRGAGRLDAFELLLNRAADVTVLQQPSWWTLRRALMVIATLVVGLGLALIWITLLRNKVEQRTAQWQKEVGERQLAEQRRAIAHERTRVAQDLHDELGAGLTEVGILGSLAKAKAIPAEAKERYVDQLTNVARSLVTSLDEIVWAVNPQYDSVDSLATYYSLFAQRFLDVAGIACRFQMSDQVPEHALDSKLRHGIFRAFKEALNNIVRHSGATEVRLLIETSEQELLLSITDNGRGFDVNRREPGSDGLSGMRQRMSDLGGGCEITSTPGRGTTVVFRLPLKGRQHDQSGNS